MGFLKRLLVILSLLFISGCSSSIIKIDAHRDSNPHAMFGEIPSRSFYLPILFGDSLKEKWQSEANGSFSNSSVAVYDSFAFVNDLSGRVYCFNIKNGKEAGKLKNKGALFGSPVIYEFYLAFAVVLEDENKTILKFYDFVSGILKQEIELKGRVTSEMIRTEKGIIALTEDGIVYYYNWRGEKIWETNTETSAHSSPSLSENILFFGNDKGEVITINIVNGNILYRKKIAEPFFSGSAIYDGKIYTGNDNGNLYSIELTTGKILWKFSSGAKITMTPAADKNILFFGNLAGNLFAVSKSDGKLIWKTEFKWSSKCYSAYF